MCRIAKSIAPVEVPLSQIKELEECYWYEHGAAQPTCSSVVEHAKLINQADLSYPVILDKGGRIMDGMHRVCKAMLDGHQSILASQFTEEIKPDYVGIEPEDLPYDILA